MDDWGNTVDYTDVRIICYVVTVLQVRRLYRVGGYMLQTSHDWNRPNNAGGGVDEVLDYEMWTVSLRTSSVGQLRACVQNEN